LIHSIFKRTRSVEAPFEKVCSTVVRLMKERVSFVTKKSFWECLKFFLCCSYRSTNEKTAKKKRWKEDSPAQMNRVMHCYSESIERFFFGGTRKENCNGKDRRERKEYTI